VGVFDCEICANIFDKKESLVSHMADVHRTSCFMCKWIFESKPDLLIHNLVCHDTSFYICGREECLLQFKSEDELGAHLDEKHVNFVKQQLSCELCGVEFIKVKSLLKHKINHHKVGDVYICSQCQFCSGSAEGLMEHERREQKQNHKPLTLPSTKPHIILDGNPKIPCKECKIKKKFKLGTDLIQHMRLKHIDVINNKGAREWKCGECKKEFKREISLNHHFIAKHNPRKELDDKLQVVKEEENLLEIEIKIEIKSEPTDQNEYFENLHDLKTEVAYNKKEEIVSELNLKETHQEIAVTDYNIKQEESALEEADYSIKVEESDDQLMVEDFKEATSEVIFNQRSENVFKEEVGQDRKSGMIRFKFPSKFNNMQDDFIKEFFEVSYGKIIKFARFKKVTRTQKKRGFRSYEVWITFEDDKASQFLDKQGHVMLDGCKLKTVACKQSEDKETLGPPPSGTYDVLKQKAGKSPTIQPSGTYSILMKKIGTSPQSINSLLLDLKVRTSKPPKEESDNDSISSMHVECDNCLLCKSKRHADNLQVPRSRTMQKVKCRSKKKNKKTKNPIMAQVATITSPQDGTKPSEVAAKPLPQAAARPPLQYQPTMASSSYYGYQNPPYGWPWGQSGHGYYPAQFGSAPWSGDRTQLGRPYCYYDGAGKMVQRTGVNARMWPY